MSKTPGAIVKVNADGSTFTQSAWFDNPFAGAAGGVTYPVTATDPKSLASTTKFVFDASAVTGVADGTTINGTQLNSGVTVGGYTVTGETDGAVYPTFYSSSNSPQNGLPFVRFNTPGQGDNLSRGCSLQSNLLLSAFSTSGNFTMIFVVRQNFFEIGYRAGSDFGGWYDTNTTEWLSAFCSTNLLYSFGMGTAENIQYSNGQPNPPNPGFAVITVEARGGNMYVRVNGVDQSGSSVATTAVGINSAMPFMIGSISRPSWNDVAYCALSIGESTAQRSAMEAFLMAKFGFGPTQMLLASATQTFARNLVVCDASTTGTVPNNTDVDQLGLFAMTNPCALTVAGAIRADAAQIGSNGADSNVHTFATNSSDGNVIDVYNKSIAGFSAIIAKPPGMSTYSSDGLSETMTWLATGAAANSAPWGGTNGGGFNESFNFQGNNFGEYRLLHSTNTVYLRFKLAAADQAMYWYDTSANVIFKMDNNDNVYVGNAALTTSATNGFFNIPSCAGPPTGTPANIITGLVPMVYDSTNNRLSVYSGSAWTQFGGVASKVYAAGTSATVPTSTALLSFGTTSPTLTLGPGTWRIRGAVRIDYSGATITNQTLTLKFRNTTDSADVTNGSPGAIGLPPATTLSYTVGIYELPEVEITITASKTIQIWGTLSGATGAGSVLAVAAGTYMIAEPV